MPQVLLTKSWKQIYKVKQNRIFYGMFYSQKTSKFSFRLDDWVLAIKPKYFRDFLEIPNFLRSRCTFTFC